MSGSPYTDACRLVERIIDAELTKNRGADVIDALLRRPRMLALLTVVALDERITPREESELEELERRK